MSTELRVQKFATEPDYLIAGTNAPVETKVKTAESAIKRGAPVELDDNDKTKVKPYTKEGKNLYGIAAEDAAEGKPAIIYLSGEFFADRLKMPADVKAADIEDELRKLGIYLKDGGYANPLAGPDGAAAFDLSAGNIENMNKKPADLMYPDYGVTVTGTKVLITGTAKNITEGWTEFDKSNNTGHFVPVKLPDALKGQKVVISGVKYGERTVTLEAENPFLVTRLENLNDEMTVTITKDGELVMTIDFSGVAME